MDARAFQCFVTSSIALCNKLHGGQHVVALEGKEHLKSHARYH